MTARYARVVASDFRRPCSHSCSVLGLIQNARANSARDSPRPDTLHIDLVWQYDMPCGQPRLSLYVGQNLLGACFQSQPKFNSPYLRPSNYELPRSLPSPRCLLDLCRELCERVLIRQPKASPGGSRVNRSHVDSPRPGQEEIDYPKTAALTFAASSPAGLAKATRSWKRACDEELRRSPAQYTAMTYIGQGRPERSAGERERSGFRSGYRHKHTRLRDSEVDYREVPALRNFRYAKASSKHSVASSRRSVD